MADSQPQSHSKQEGNGNRGADSEWPYASLLFWGFFGLDTPEGRRFGLETAGWFALLALAAVTAAVGRVPAALGVALPIVVLGLGWSYTRYLSRLDELSRRIQLDSFAVSYGAAMALGAGLAGWAMVDPEGLGAISPAALFWVLGGAEVVRGVVLVRLARRYR